MLALLIAAWSHYQNKSPRILCAGFAHGFQIKDAPIRYWNRMLRMDSGEKQDWVLIPKIWYRSDTHLTFQNHSFHQLYLRLYESPDVARFKNLNLENPVVRFTLRKPIFDYSAK